MRTLAAVALVLAGCADETIDERLPLDYREDPTWSFRITYGATPGHGDTIRYIFANTAAQEYVGGRTYPPGSIIVKEVYGNNGGERGTLQVVEVMRMKAQTITELPQSNYYDERFGWVFTATSERGGGEETDRSDFCWRRCHANAPIAGAWFNYGVPTP